MKKIFIISFLIFNINFYSQNENIGFSKNLSENSSLETTLEFNQSNLITSADNQDETIKEHKIKYRLLLEIGHQFGVGEYKSDRFNFDISNGILIENKVFLGVGLGLRLHNGYSELPVYLQVRTMNLEKNIFPYISISAGYGFELSGFDGLGIYFKPSIGVNMKVSEKNIFNFGLCLDSQYIPKIWMFEAHAAKAIGLEIGYSF